MKSTYNKSWRQRWVDKNGRSLEISFACLLCSMVDFNERSLILCCLHVWFNSCVQENEFFLKI